MFHTYCILHNKSCPITKPGYLSRTWDLERDDHRRDILKLKTWNGRNGSNGNLFDLWINHILYSDYIHSLIPSAKHQIVSIIRNPIDRFISGFRYYKLERHLHVNISTYILQLYANYSKFGPYAPNIDPTPHIGYQLNSQCRSLIRGYVEPMQMDKYNAWNSIQSGEWLLLITERFDESLLILMNAYNLSAHDLVYKRQKGGVNRILYEDAYNPNDEEREMIKKMNGCDWKLYTLALELFEYRLYEIYGGDQKRKQRDLERLDAERERELTRCGMIKRKVIEKENCREHGLRDVDEFMFYKSVYCKSLNKDNLLWNKWAHLYLHNDTYRTLCAQQLMNLTMCRKNL